MGKLGGIILLSALAVSGCSAPAAPVEPAASVESNHLIDVKSELKVMHDAPDATIEHMAVSVCNLYTSGKNATEVTELVIAASKTLDIGDDGIKVARAAVANKCPQFG